MRKRVIAITDLDDEIDALARQTDHKILATWAADCAERVLHYFEDQYPDDDRPRKAIEACRTWVETGVFRMKGVRGVSLGAHAAARQVDDFNPARSAARAAGQAIATAHVKTHAIAAARYATTVLRDASEPDDADVAALAEREWQYQHLQALVDGA